MLTWASSRLLVRVIAIGALAAMARMGVGYITGHYELAFVLGNGAFMVGLAVSCLPKQAGALPLVRDVILAPLAYIIVALGLALVGLLTPWPLLKIGLMALLAVGYYPTGADMAFESAAPVWMLSVVAMTWVGLAGGILLRRRLEGPAEEYETSEP